MRIDPEQLPSDSSPLEWARAWASVGNTNWCNHWLDQIPDVTDDIVMELRRLARDNCLKPWTIGTLREPWKYLSGQMELFG